MTFTRAKAAGWKDFTDKVTAAELTALNDNLADAIDGVGGSTIPSQVNFNGQVTLENTLVYDDTATACSVWVPWQNAVLISEVIASPDFVNYAVRVPPDPYAFAFPGGWFQDTVPTLAEPSISFVTRVPHNAAITSVVAYLRPVAVGRPVLPNLPSLQVGLRDVTTDAYDGSVSDVTDGSASVVAYETVHTITAFNSGTHIFDAEKHLLAITFTGEWGAVGPVQGMCLLGIVVNFTPTEYDFRGSPR